MAKTVLFALAFLLIFLMQIVIMPTPVMAQTSAISSSTSQKTQSFIVSDGFIAYIDMTKPDMRSSYDIDFIPPDGISKLLSVEIIVKGDFPPSSIVTITLNGVPCNPREWKVPESDKKYIENYETVFECVDNAKELIGRKWTVDFSTNAVASNVRLTYKNKYFNDWNLPEVLKTELGGKLTMHGTEYIFGQTAKVWLQLLDSNNSVVNDGVCFADVYKPDGTILIEEATMTNMEHDGIYYYDTVPPEVEGVYQSVARCYYEAGQVYNYATGITYINSTYKSGTLSNTYVLDDVYLKTEELGNVTPRRYAAELSFNSPNVCNNISELLLTGITIGWTGKWDSKPTTDFITVSIYNHTSSSWINLANTITAVGAGSKTVTNTFFINNITNAGLVNSSGSNVRLRFIDTTVTDGDKDEFNYDYLYVSCNELTSPEWVVVRGSSEIHISNLTELLEASTASAVWNYPNRTLTDYNQTLMWAYLGQINTTTSAISPFLTAINLSLYSYIFQVNNSIYTRINEVDTSLSNSINNVNNNLNSVNSSLYNLILSVNGSIINNQNSINSSLFSKLNEIQSLMNSVNISLYNHISDVNLSLYGKLVSMQTELQNIYNINVQINDTVANLYLSLNTTALDNLIRSVNQSLYTKISESEAATYAVNNSIMSKLYLLQSELADVNLSLYGRMGQTDNLILSVNGSLFNQIANLQIDVLNTYNQVTNVYAQLNATNQSIMNKLYALQTELSDVNSSIHDRMGQTDSLILSVNSSLYNQITDLKGDVLNIYNEVVNVYSQVNATNQSIMNKLYMMQFDLANIYSINQEINSTVHNISINLTPITDFLYVMNQSMGTGFLDIQNSVYSVNQSIMNKLYLMQDDLANIYTINQQINDTVNGLPSAIANISLNLSPVLDFLTLMNSTMLYEFSDTKGIIYAVNSSIFGKLYLIQNDLSDIYAISQDINGTVTVISINLLAVNQSITDAIYQMNSSITNELYGIRDQLQNVTGDLAQVMLLIGDVNESLTDQLYQIQNGVNDLSSIINLTNQTIMTKLYKIQDEITSVNDTVKSSNLTIMGKLDIITSDIYAINASIITYLLLISNVTVNITLSQQALFNDMVAMWGDSITPKVYSAGFTGFLPSAYAQEEGQYVCLNNQTLRKTVNITLDTPDGLRDYVRTIDTQCTYGCKNNTCVQPDYMLYILLLIAVIAMYVIYRHWFADRGMT